METVILMWSHEAAGITDMAAGGLKYIWHTTVSSSLITVVITEEATKTKISHCLCCFSILDVSNKIKTNIITDYYSQSWDVLLTI